MLALQTIRPKSQTKANFDLSVTEETYYEEVALTVKVIDNQGNVVDSITRKATVNYNGFKD